MSAIEEHEVWIFYDSYGAETSKFPVSLLGKLGLLNFELKVFLAGEYTLVKYLGSIPIEPTWDDFFQEYIYSMNALDQALQKRGIDPYNGVLPCLNEEECQEFKNAIELAEFLKNEIDKYQPTKDSNELIEYIEFLKENCDSFPFIDCGTNKKEFADDYERKDFLKAMIDRYVETYSIE